MTFEQIRKRLMVPADIRTNNGLIRCCVCGIYKPERMFSDTLNKYTKIKNKGKQYGCIACVEKQKLI
jgi:hypothetical protein